jgi:hypothetical protein
MLNNGTHKTNPNKTDDVSINVTSGRVRVTTVAVEKQ